MTTAKKTVSRLARIWDHRREVVELQMRNTALALQREGEALMRWQGDLEKLLQDFEEGVILQPVGDLKDLELFLGEAFRKIQEENRTQERMRNLKKEWAERQEVWKTLYQKNKALEILEKKLEQQEMLEVLRAEQKNTDALTLIRRRR